MRLGLNLSMSMGQLVQTLASYVLNFFTETFKADNGANTFAGAVTHSRSGQATMTSGYGPEIVDNGSFDSDVVGWTASGSTTIEWSDGALRVNQPSGGNWHTNKVVLDGNPLVAGKVYSLTFDARDISTSSGFTLWTNAVTIITVTSNTAPPLSSDWNSYSATFTAEPNGSFRIASNSGTGSFELDNISIREIPSIKWAPHNLLTYSEELDNAAWSKQSGTTVTTNQATAPDGTSTADLVVSDGTLGVYQAGITVPTDGNNTKAVWLKGVSGGESVKLKDPNRTVGTTTCNLTTEWQLFTLTETQTGGIAGLWVADIPAGGIYIWGAHLYRSDLGGMVDNPDRGDSYVPTTSSAVYLPRRGHHIYNGYEWVNEGLLHESEARTNNLLYSENFANVWSKTDATATPTVESMGPDGITSATKLGDSGAGGTGAIYLTYAATVSPSTTYTYSVFAKAGQLSDVLLYQNNFTSPANNGYYFDLLNGTFSAYSGTPPITALMEYVGNGWYRCSITFTTDAADASGNLQIYAADGTGLTLPLDGTSNILIYGAQFEAGSTPSSYIPTSGATVTRAAESLTIPSANLPWPTPQYIGSELVTNGDFSNGVTGWSHNNSSGTSTFAVSGGEATFTRGAFGDSFYQSDVAPAIAGVYLLKFDVTAISGGNLRYSFSPNSARNTANEKTITAIGSYSTAFVSDGTLLDFVFDLNANGASVTIDNISVKEINPLALSIQMNGRVSYIDDDQVGTVALWSWTNGPNYLRGYIRTDSTKTGMPYVQQNKAGTLDVVNMSDAEEKTPGVFVPFNIAARHGSTFVNAASDGVAQLVNTTPTGLPDIENYNLALGNIFMGTIESFQIWDRDIGDTGIVDESSPDLEPSLSLVFDSSFNSFVVKDWSE